MSDGLEDAYLHNTVEAIEELISTYGVQTFFSIIDADTYDQLKGYIFHIENIEVVEDSDATSS